MGLLPQALGVLSSPHLETHGNGNEGLRAGSLAAPGSDGPLDGEDLLYYREGFASLAHS